MALDDGSSDGTGDVLRSSSLVRVVLDNPSRPSYAGWDDGANRNRLLAAAGDLAPRWVISLDVDERIDPDDATALRRFIETDAIPGLAYGFLVHRMIGDLEHYDRADFWVYRLFFYEPGQSFPRRRLHFVPIPTSISKSRRVRTTIRIQHLAGLNQESRRGRFLKYQAADPDGRFDRDYVRILDEPETVRRWERRAEGLPVLDPGERPLHVPAEEIAPDAPILSVIVISHDDERTISRTVSSITSQETADPFEVIVVASGSDRTPEVVRDRYPDVRVIQLDGRALPGRARNAGVWAARGEFVSFPGSHIELLPGSLDARIRAHRDGHPMVTGTTLNGTKTRAGWASYFLDHSSTLPGRPSGKISTAPIHCSYDRGFVLEVGGFPEDMRAGEDTVVNRRLWRRGCRAYRAQGAAFIHRSRCMSVPLLIAHHFVRGRAFGRILGDSRVGRSRIDRALARYLLRDYVRNRLRSTSRNVRRWGGPEYRARYRSVRPLVVAGTLAALLGVWVELVFGRRATGASGPSPAGAPPVSRPADASRASPRS